MKHIRHASHEATEVNGPRNSRIAPDGWRKPTAALAQADQLADIGAHRAAPKARCVVALKRVGAHLGLKAADLLLLDTLAAFTQPQDWEAGQRPIVWPSNAYLMAQTGFSLSTLKRHARRLVEVGVITFRDSPNGKRWGRRDAEGRIVEAYGFDLAPLAARVETLEALAAEVQAERAQCQVLRRQITIARRAIRARIETARDSAFGGAWAAVLSRFEALLARLPARNAGVDVLRAASAQFDELLARIEAMFQAATGAGQGADLGTSAIENAQETRNMTPKEVNSDPHIPTTNELHSVTCNSSEHEERGQGAPGCSVDPPVETEAKGVDLATILQACPEFTSWARTLGGYVRDWRDFARVSSELRPMIGISENAWAVAEAQMGKPTAAAALALVFDKFNTGEVTSPGGYLRGMVEKSRAGELHLDRSFFGRLNASAS